MTSVHIIGGGSVGLLISSSLQAFAYNNHTTTLESHVVKLLLRAHHKHRLFPTDNSNNNDDDDQSISQCIKVRLHRINNRTSSSSTTVPFSSTLVDVPTELIPNNDDYKTNYSNENQSISQDIENLVVVTKAGDALNAIQSVIHRFKNDDSNRRNRIILLSNGALAIKDELEGFLVRHKYDNPKCNIRNISLVLGSMTHGSHQDTSILQPSCHKLRTSNDNFFDVIHAGQGQMWINDEDIANVFASSKELSCQYASTSMLQEMLWKKLAANCVINPLTTILNCRNGDLRNCNNHYLNMMDQIIQEVSSVATIYTDDCSNKACFSFDEMKSFVDKVLSDTCQNKSSMLQDFQNKRKTEIQYLNGYISRLGRRFGVETHANNKICENILNITSY